MRGWGWAVLLGAALGAVPCWGQEYRIGRPTEQLPTPVYLTRPVEGQVEVSNLPPVQDVRITGGTVEGPVEVRGDVGLRVTQPLPVEVNNFPEFPTALQVDGPVRVDDTQPLRVWVENQPEAAAAPAAPAPSPAFVAYFFKGTFSAKDGRVRRAFRAPDGAVFHLTDLSVDARSDAALKVRVTAAPGTVVGALAGVEGADQVPVALLDTQSASAVRLGTAVPLGGEFAVEVEALGPGLGAPFWAVASGFVTAKPASGK